MNQTIDNLYVSYKKLKAFVCAALMKNGMRENDAQIVAELLTKTEMWGIHTHGVKNLSGYIQKKKAGGVSFDALPKIVLEQQAVEVIDANNTLGFVSGSFGMNEAIRLAKKAGIGMVVVKNSSHYGAGFCYGDIAASQGFIGVSLTNVDRKMAIPGTIGMTMGHNPFTLCAPASIIPSVCIDASSSNVSSLKVLNYKAQNKKVPLGWITDKDGCPTDDPSHYPDEGALTPMGNYKGYGIAFFIDILTGVLGSSLNSVSDNIPSWCFDLDKPNQVSHAFIAINGKLFNENFVEAIDQMIISAKSNKKAAGTEEIFVPGEDMWRNYQKCIATGQVYLPKDVVEELVKTISYEELVK